MPTRWRGCAIAPCITALLVLILLAVVAEAGDFGGHVRAAFVPRSHSSILVRTRGLTVRGGASTVIEEEDEDEESESEEEDEEDEEIAAAQNKGDDDEEEEEEEEEEQDEEALDPKLTAAAMKSSVKTKAKLQAQKSAKLKETVSAQLMAGKTTSVPKPEETKTSVVATKKKKKGGGFFRLPYIVRACLNPITAFAMTRAFWVSLFNLDYPPKEASQDLRSSLEEKGRMGGNTFQSKPKRKMKRGQAKTLSDLPQLNT